MKREHKTSHTPGPWDRDCPLSEPHLLDICQVNPPKEAGNPLVIAIVQWDEDHPEHPTLAEANANARLIAVAPELLAACEEVLRQAACAEEDQRAEITNAAIKQIANAVAKAKGQ